MDKSGALRAALQPDFRSYQQGVLDNAQTLARTPQAEGHQGGATTREADAKAERSGSPACVL